MIPAGAVPLGSFQEFPASRARSPIPILADYIDEVSGDISRLDEGRTPIDGACIEVLRVERGSGPAVREVGHTLREVRHTDPSSLAELKGRLRDGFRRMEKAGLVKVESIEVKTLENAADSVEMSGEIKDLTLAEQDVNGNNNVRTYAVPRGLPNG